jgi:hypothetical protein
MNVLLALMEWMCGFFCRRWRWQPVPVRPAARAREVRGAGPWDECQLERFWLPVVGWLTWTPVRRSYSPDDAVDDPQRSVTAFTRVPPSGYSGWRCAPNRRM